MESETAAKDYTHIRAKELLSIFITATIIGFIMSFRSWGKEDIDIVLGFTTFVVTALAAFAFFLIRLWSKKFVALKLGYLTTYTIHKWTFPISIFMVIFTNGFVPYVSTGDIKIKESKRLRLGWFRYGLNYTDLATIGVAAPISMVILMILIKPIVLITGNFYIMKILQTAAAITICGMLPIYGQEGFDIFYFRRWLYVIVLTFVVVYFLLILTFGIFSYVVALILAIAAMWVYQSQLN